MKTTRDHAFGVALAIAAAWALMMIGEARGQQFRSSLDVVEVYATVRTGQGVFARDLTREDFELYDNGQRRDIAVFSSDVQATAIAVLLDRSGSVQRQAGQVSEGASTFLTKLLPDDRVSLGSLTWDCLALTADKARLTSVLNAGMPPDMGSPVWGGTNRVLTSLAGEGGRRAILLFSDGDDYPMLMPPIGTIGPGGVTGLAPASLANAAGDSGCQYRPDSSLATIDDIVSRAEREGVLLYTVSVDNAARSTKDGDLRRVARESGGERYRLRDYDELPDAFERIADELHHQYLLGFVPAVLDGKRHEIDVRVRRNGVTVRARKSYVAVRVDSPSVRSNATAAKSAEPETADIEWAIAQGLAGQKLQASCAAAGIFSKPEETGALVQVTVEGPLGRIMRVAREARLRRMPFGLAQVTAGMRAAVVEVTADLRPPSAPASNPAVDPPPPPPTAPPPTALGPLPMVPASVSPPASGPRPPLALRVRSREVITAVLDALPDPPPPRALTGSPRIAQRFDLHAFRSLPGSEIEVVVHSTTGARRCVLPAKEVAAIR